jgi:hypothetical protein
MRYAFKVYARELERWPELACHPVSLRGAWAFVRHLERLNAIGRSLIGRPLVTSIKRNRSCDKLHTSIADLQTRGSLRFGRLELDPCATWLTLAHECAHVVEWVERKNDLHDHAFERRVSEIAGWIELGDWHVRDLAEVL